MFRGKINPWLLGITLIVVVLFGLSFWSETTKDINRSPELQFETETLTVSVTDGDDVLLQGVSAWDPEDGDVTTSLVIEGISVFQEDGARLVTYAAFDSNDNVAKGTRRIYYSDYRAPQIILLKELRVNVGENLNLQSYVEVDDVLDGKITNLLQVKESNFSSYTPGEYALLLEVTNSAGDTATQSFVVTCAESTQYSSVSITLNAYSVNLVTGDYFDPQDYLEAVTGKNADGEALTTADVLIADPVNTEAAGSYTVTYTLSGNGEVASTRLIVTVE